MKKGKKKITIEIDQRLVAVCEKYGVEPQKLFKQLQADILGNRKLEAYYQQILAELYFTEFISSTAEIDRSSIESVLNFNKSFRSHKSDQVEMPNGISRLTRKILKDCNYSNNHSKN